MAAAKDGHQQFVEDLFLADDDFADLVAHLLVSLAQRFEHVNVGFLDGGTHEKAGPGKVRQAGTLNI